MLLPYGGTRASEPQLEATTLAKKASRHKTKRVRSATGTAAKQPQNVACPSYTATEIVPAANLILRREAPDVPPVPSPGRAALVIGLYHAGKRGDELDYRPYDERWIVLQQGLSSYCPADYLPFTIIASEAGAIEYHTGRDDIENLHELLPKLCKLFSEPKPIVGDPPKGISPEMHRNLSMAAAYLQSEIGGSWTRGMLIHKYEETFAEEVSPTTASAWLAGMRDRGDLGTSGQGRGTQYRIPSSS